MGIGSIVICFQAKGKLKKERVSHLKNGRVTGEKCGQVSLATDKSQGWYATESHIRLLFPQENKNSIRKLNHPLHGNWKLFWLKEG